MSDIKVMIGKDGWLFLSNDSNKVIEQTTGNFAFPENFYSEWRNLFKFRRDQANAIGFQYIYSVAPNKETIYNRYLPEGIKLSPRRPVAVVESAASNVVSFHYPLEEMIEASKVDQVYSKGDTHWSGLGGYLFYKGLMSKLGVEAVDNTRISFEIHNSKSDLSSKISAEDEVWKAVIYKSKARLKEANGITNIGRKSAYDHVNRNLPSAVIFHDSFVLPIMNILAETFSRTVMVWQPNIDYSIIESEKPDIVISQQAERFLISCPDDIYGRSHAEWVAYKKSRL